MRENGIYILAFFLIFLVLPLVYILIRYIIADYLGNRRRRIARTQRNCPNRGLRSQQDRLGGGRETVLRYDRQGNVFTIHDESTRESRYNDIFFIEPNSAEAARIRAQLEKDDKDLPSYEEVMRMTSVTSTTPANTAAMTASNASVNTAETRLSVPPYSEVDPNASSTSLHAVGNATTINSASAATPTTQTQSTPPPPLFAAAVVSSSVTQATLNV
ncbi:uncharacterized protein LOC106096145 isoform X3 [Stomoxys calcitrans]|uniref:Uncharacterized protein n=1 Tax=Stomoxys calcitrans TaxID=35570 RepID=A0A1I8P484_STOCA|nr:uncharacterized protein LOC106096145 isoform X3 [Stomoxys calcitrans]